MNLVMEIIPRTFRRRTPFRIAKWVRTEEAVVVAVLRDNEGRAGFGEATGDYMTGETQASMMTDLERIRSALEAGATADEALAKMPPGGARNAFDSARLDLRAKQSGVPVWTTFGLPKLSPQESTDTISLDTPGAMAVAASETDHRILKLKMDHELVLERVTAVRRARPDASLILDANEAWNLDTLNALAPQLADLGVVLIEQPLKRGSDSLLAHYTGPLPLAADESFASIEDIDAIGNFYNFVNIKLDKCGGLSAAMTCVDALTARGIGLMVGCLGGSTLANAPGFLLAQRCAFVDLDSSKPLIDPFKPELEFRSGWINRTATAMWGVGT